MGRGAWHWVSMGDGSGVRDSYSDVENMKNGEVSR